MVNCIVCAIDGSEHSNRAVQLAVDLAKLYNAKLRLLHVYMTGMSLSEIDEFSEHPELSDLIKEENARLTEVAVAIAASAQGVAYVPSASDEVVARIGQVILEDARKIAASASVGDVSVSTANGSPASEIVSFAEAQGADMVVIGSRGLGGLSSVFLGSTSMKVAHLVQCTCVTVK